MCRRPNSENHETRLPLIRTYILEELPSFITGIEYKGKKYQTMVYPTAAAYKCYNLASLIHDIQTSPGYSEMRQEVLSLSTTIATTGQVILPLSTSLVQEARSVKRFRG